jgi:hypothetical protein
MRDGIRIEGDPLNEGAYRDAIGDLVSKGYETRIDPREFDTPLSIKARFKSKHPKIRFIEFSPDLEISIEHNITKTAAKNELKKIEEDFLKVITVGSAKIEDYELATLQMITRKDPVLIPKDAAEEKLFMSLEEKKIFSKVISIACPKCKRGFMMPAESIDLEDNRIFCKECNAWFANQDGKHIYVVNEEYMKVMDSVWDKVNKIIKSSWREITKRGIPMLPKSDESRTKKRASKS